MGSTAAARCAGSRQAAAPKATSTPTALVAMAGYRLQQLLGMGMLGCFRQRSSPGSFLPQHTSPSETTEDEKYASLPSAYYRVTLRPLSLCIHEMPTTSGTNATWCA
jgi:hypothetical protein